MRRVAVALALAATWLLAPASAYSDTDLEAQVAQAFLPRTHSPELHDLAHQRAVEIASDFSHNGATTVEVLAWNQGYPDPLGRAVVQWLSSPVHAGILSDPSYGAIGCAAHVVGDTTYAACLLGRAATVAVPEPEPVAPAPRVATGPGPTPIPLLPNTSILVKSGY